MEIKVDTTELVKWAYGLNAAAKATRGTIAKALNKLGNDLANSLAVNFSENTGLSSNDIRKLFEIKKATTSDLFWELDAANLLDVEEPSRKLQLRQWEKRKLPQFPPGILVNVITAGDIKVDITTEGGRITKLVEVCEICEQKAEEGPYTIEKIRAMGAKWSDFAPQSYGETNLFHPHCRCTVWPVNRKASQITYEPRRAPQPRVKTAGPGFQMPNEGTGAGTALGKEFEVMAFSEFAKLMGGG